MIVPAFIEPQDSAPLPSREIIHLRSFTTISTYSAGSRSRIGEAQVVPHRLYSEVIRECHFLHGRNHELRRMNDHRAVCELMWLGEKARALAEIVSRRLAYGVSTSEGDRDAEELVQLLQWVTRDLQSLGRI